MNIIIKTKNIKLTEALKNFTEKKFFSLRKFINILKKEEEKKTLAEVFVELEKETKHHRKGDIFVAKCNIQLPGRSLMSKAKSDDILKAIIAAKDEIKTEIEKYKFKKIAKRRREQRKIKREGII
ncbi:MAG: HPF/RaiA family ribosome-associated protein [bacterium]